MGYQDVLARVEAAAARCGRAGGVRLIAVSKTVPAERLRGVVEEGAHRLGENYVQEFVQKYDQMSDLNKNLEWHFIGHLQTNKVKLLLPRIALLHTLDRPSLLEELARRAPALERPLPVLIEVNLGDEASKSGIAPDALPDFARQVASAPGIQLQGLMAIPPAVTPEEGRPYFRQLFQLREGLRQQLGLPLPELSMGMSADFEVAIEEGATLVRVGSAIFGARRPAGGGG